MNKPLADTGAVKPNFFAGLPESIKPSAQKVVMSVGDEERSLAALSNHSGWTVLEGFMDSLLNELEAVTDAGMAQGLSLEEIGRNALVANLAKGMIRRIQQKVGDAREAIEKEDGLQK